MRRVTKRSAIDKNKGKRKRSKKKTAIFSVDPALMCKFRKECEANNLSMSSVVELLIKRFVGRGQSQKTVE